MSEAILFFRQTDAYGWMSNLFPTTITMPRRNYWSVEHWYQSQKTTDVLISDWIANSPTAFMAMMNGKNLPKKYLRSDWEKVKVGIMLTGIRQKFFQSYKYLGEKLLETGNRPIHESNPKDAFWGMNGQDMLGKLLCHVRAELREQKTIEFVSKP